LERERKTSIFWFLKYLFIAYINLGLLKKEKQVLKLFYNTVKMTLIFYKKMFRRTMYPGSIWPEIQVYSSWFYCFSDWKHSLPFHHIYYDINRYNWSQLMKLSQLTVSHWSSESTNFCSTKYDKLGRLGRSDSNKWSLSLPAISELQLNLHYKFTSLQKKISK
jgi:hypothetical protein